jgi:hypothetical protein
MSPLTLSPLALTFGTTLQVRRSPAWKSEDPSENQKRDENLKTAVNVLNEDFFGDKIARLALRGFPNNFRMGITAESKWIYLDAQRDPDQCIKEPTYAPRIRLTVEDFLKDPKKHITDWVNNLTQLYYPKEEGFAALYRKVADTFSMDRSEDMNIPETALLNYSDDPSKVQFYRDLA